MTASPAPSCPPPAKVAAGDAWPLVWLLAIAQLVSWGTLYYAFALFVLPMEQSFGWTRPAVSGALSAGLLAAGLAAYGIGAWIDRHGGRSLMTAGSALGGATLLAWSQIDSLPGLYGVGLGLGLAMAGTLYEPAFAVITRRFPDDFRQRITVLTLVGGFASTVFLPLTGLAIDHLGWRGALAALALANIAISLPIHALGLRDSPGRHGPAQPARPGAVRRAVRHPAFWGLALCFTSYYLGFTALIFHLIPLLTERGLPPAMVIAAFAVVGPAQVAGRAALLLAGPRLRPAMVGRLVVLGLPLALLLLILLPDSTPALFVFAVLFGASNGLMTILRGTAVADLLWRDGYGAINGLLTLPANVARAAAPLAAAMIWSRGGYDAVLWSCLGVTLLAAAGFWAAASAAGQ